MIDKTLLARSAALGAITVAATACGHLPIQPPAFEAMKAERVGIPEEFTLKPMTGDTGTIVQDYSVFNDTQLTAYIQEALDKNRTLRSSLEAVKQSQATLKQVRSSLWPTLRASAGVSASSPTDDIALNNERYSFAVTGAYNLDIMGDLDTSIRGSLAGLRSTEASYELARRNLAAQVARAYFSVVEQQLQVALDRRSYERSQSTFRIIETRFSAGQIARDDYVNGQATLASAEDSILASEISYRNAVRSLEVLLGRFPQNRIDVAAQLPTAPAAPPLGLPELTIRARPDVMAAELNLIQTFASNRNVRLGAWPQLNADFGLGVSNGPQLTTSGLFSFDDLALSIGLSVAQTLFDGGATEGRIEASDSGKRAALARYGQTIIDAYSNILGAIDTFNSTQSRARVVQANFDARAEVLRLAQLKYQEGSQSLFELISFQESADAAESAQISNKLQQLNQWIALHTALGGSPFKPTGLATEADTAEGSKK